MKEVVVEANTRDSVGKNKSRRLRRQGMIPGILYGADQPSVALSVDPKMLLQILHSESGANTLFQLGLQGEAQRSHVMIKEYQVDPLGGHLLHADFVRIKMDEVVEVEVPVHFTGESVGVKLDGGILDHVTRAVAVSCLPGNIPEQITIDVSALKIGDSLRVSDLPRTDRYTILSDPEQTIVVISAPIKEEEAAAPAVDAATVAPTEPEVIKKGKAPAEAGDSAAAEEGGKKDSKKDSKK